MQLPPHKDDKELFEDLAKSAVGLRLQQYLERLIRCVESVRTETNLSIEARREVGNVLEQHLVDRLKVSRGEVDAPDSDEYE